jgi:nucleotide-binding universal stress UspA family protein
MARSNRSKLTLLHVLEFPPSWYSDIEAARLSSLVDLNLIRENRQEQLDQYLERNFHDLAPLRVLSQGDPGLEIVQFAKKEGIGLIMMPTRGLGFFRRSLLGSVTAKVLHDATCPVWTSAHTEHVTPVRYPHRTVACAVDLSEASLIPLRWAREFASEQGADIRVVHAINVNEESTNPGVLEVRRYLCEKALSQWKMLETTLGWRAPLQITYGSVGTALRKAVHDLHVDMMIIGRGRTNETAGRFLTDSYTIIRESPCPVISI